MAIVTDIIETERLRLRGINETDAPQIAAWRGDPAVYRYFKNPRKITEAEHLRWYRERYLPDKDREDRMCLTKDGERIGVFGLIREGDSAEVSYLLAPEARGKGYAAEAVNGLLRYAKETWRVCRVTAEIHKENGPSLALARRLGFVPADETGDFIIFEKEV